jgi:hypothetical protein
VTDPDGAVPELFDRPVLVVDPGMHTAIVRCASSDKEYRWIVTGSGDKTLRIWAVDDGALLRTIRLPAGAEDVGKVFAVAMHPDGELIAVGGLTRPREAKVAEQIYLFDRVTGALVQRIESLPGSVNCLVFSPDGERLAALLDGHGLRVYASDRKWTEVARDEKYVNQSYGAVFSSDGRLATTSFDNLVRLYDSELEGNVQPVVCALLTSLGPYGIAFSPDGAQLAVGCTNAFNVILLNGRSLAPLPSPRLDGLGRGALGIVAWSRDGLTLFVAGKFKSPDGRSLIIRIGPGKRTTLPAGQNTVMTLIVMPDGDLLVATQGPWLARLGSDGTPRWVRESPIADFRGQFDRLSVSDDGTRVGFGFEEWGKSLALFDVRKLALDLAPTADNQMTFPRQEGLPIEGWHNGRNPTFGGKRLPLKTYEESHCFALHPSRDRFVLGAQFYLRAFDDCGVLLWERPVPGEAWAVNITGDGRLVVAAYADGTIRWHRMSDGVELLNFMPRPDRTNWVAWTPEGYYGASSGTHGVLRWHVNRESPHSVPIGDIPGSYRPAVLPLVLQELETPRALGLAEMAEHRREVMLRTNSRVPPGARLHLLAVGISAYNEDHARSLRLQYAHRDAADLACAIENTQGSLYQVRSKVLLDEKASKVGILRALERLRTDMEAGGGNDLAVVAFSGHGDMVDDQLYLLPYDVNSYDGVSIRSSALSAKDLRSELLQLAQHGRVLVLLDACRSGAMTMDGAEAGIDSDALRRHLVAANVTVMTSSQGSEKSEEDPKWQHGAFTKALIEAFDDPIADVDRNGLISPIGLANYVVQRVRALTNGKQTPVMEIKFHSTLFVSNFRAPF